MSFPQRNYEALTIANSIITNWSLTGQLAKQGQLDATKASDPVYIKAHQPPEGTVYRKAVIVEKISPIEDVIEHPTFDEVSNTYSVTCRYTLEGYQSNTWDNAESLMQQMENEVVRILKLSYDPASGTGDFFVSNRIWDVRDDFTGETKVLLRSMSFKLTKLRSRITTVFKPYPSGILAFDVTNSQGVNLPAQNYVYTECYHVDKDQGYQVQPEFVAQNDQGQHIPVLFTVGFNGFFAAKIWAKKADIGGTATSQLDKIWQLLTNGETPRVFFIQTSLDSESPTETLTMSTPVRITNFKDEWDQEKLVALTIQGRITKPTAMTIS